MVKNKLIYIPYLFSLLIMQLGLGQGSTDYIPPAIDNPNGAEIEWLKDGSVIVKGGPVTFTTGIKALPIDLSPQNQINTSEMLLLDEISFMQENGNSQTNDFGVKLKIFEYLPDWWTGSGTMTSSAKIKIFRRNDNNPQDISTSFGFDDFIYDHYLVYGNGSEIIQYDNGGYDINSLVWDINYAADNGWRFWKEGTVKINSNDYIRLWNRPVVGNTAKWAKVTGTVLVVVVGLAFAEMSFLAYAEYVDALAILETGVFPAYPEAAASSIALNSYTAYRIYGASSILTTMIGTLALYNGLYEYNNQGTNFIDEPYDYQAMITSNMELPIPSELPETGGVIGEGGGQIITDELRRNMEHNKIVKKLKGNGVFDCSVDSSQSCFNAPISGAVARLEDVSNAHIQNIRIPGALYKEMTPYQLIKNFDYVYEKNGKQSLETDITIQSERISDVFVHSDGSPVDDILPRHFFRATSNGVTATLKFEGYNYDSPKYYYLIDKEQPLQDVNESRTKNLGEFGYIDGEKYNLYRFLVRNMTGDLNEISSVSFTMNTDGPFLAGDNIVLENQVGVDEGFVVSDDNDFDPSYFYPPDVSIPVDIADVTIDIQNGGNVAIIDTQHKDNVEPLVGDDWGFYIGEVVTFDVDENGEHNTSANMLTSNAAIIDSEDYTIPDFVFENTYEKLSLSDLEEYISLNKHLPYLKGEREIREKGFYSTNQRLIGQLQNLEELLLHTIEQEKKLETLRNNNNTLKQRLIALDNKLKKLENNE